MLILTRRVGETVFATLPPNVTKEGIEVTITILGVKGNQVRVGLQAPPEVSLDREEIHQRKKLERAEDDAKRQVRNQR